MASYTPTTRKALQQYTCSVDWPGLASRALSPDDRVLSTSQAAKALRRTRQAVDQGLRSGRIAGFRDPSTGRLWVDLDYVNEHCLTLESVADRLTALEDQVQALNVAPPTGHPSASSGPVVGVDALQERIAELEEANLLLLAAAAQRDEADDLVHDAERLEQQARDKRAEAAQAQSKAQATYREVVGQRQVPRDIGRLR